MVTLLSLEIKLTSPTSPFREVTAMVLISPFTILRKVGIGDDVVFRSPETSIICRVELDPNGLVGLVTVTALPGPDLMFCAAYIIIVRVPLNENTDAIKDQTFPNVSAIVGTNVSTAPRIVNTAINVSPRFAEADIVTVNVLPDGAELLALLMRFTVPMVWNVVRIPAHVDEVPVHVPPIGPEPTYC
jgi:hypothetical protein